MADCRRGLSVVDRVLIEVRLRDGRVVSVNVVHPRFAWIVTEWD